MNIYSNILFASIILSTFILIITYRIFDEYDIDTRDYIKFSLNILISITLSLMYFKCRIQKDTGFKVGNATTELFDEVSTMKSLGGMPNIISAGNDLPFELDLIPNIQ